MAFPSCVFQSRKVGGEGKPKIRTCVKNRSFRFSQAAVDRVSVLTIARNEQEWIPYRRGREVFSTLVWTTSPKHQHREPSYNISKLAFAKAILIFRAKAGVILFEHPSFYLFTEFKLFPRFVAARSQKPGFRCEIYDCPVVVPVPTAFSQARAFRS